MKKKYFLFLLIIFLCPFVNASSEIDVTSNCYGSTGYPRMYSGYEVNYQSDSLYSFGTTYQYQLSSFETELRYNFTSDTDYVLTFNTNGGNDFRNNFQTWEVYDLDNNDNQLSTNFVFVSMKKIQLYFKTTSATSKVGIQFGGSNVYDAITGDTNWNIKNVILSIPDTPPSPPSGGSSNDDIINNNTNNTNNIINNNNTNTNNIIDNANNNAQSIIDNQNQNNQSIINGIDSVNSQLGSCYKNILSFSNLVPAENVNISNKSFVQKSADTGAGANAIKLQFFDSSGTLIGQINNDPLNVARFNFFFTNSNEIYYMKFGVNGSSTDTLVGLYTNDLDLESNSTYTLSFSITNATQGHITFKNFSLIKGNYSGDFIDYGKSVCTSKLDDVSNSVNNSTNTIINNQNQNTQDIIDSNKVCKNIGVQNILIKKAYLDDSGNVVNNDYFQGITDYIKIDKTTKMTALSSSPLNGNYLCFYTANKGKISCINEYTFTTDMEITVPSNASYFRTSIISSRPVVRICDNGNQAMTNALTDDSVDSDTGNSFFNDFDDEDFGLSDIITIPLSTIQSLTSKSCVALSVPIPFTNSNVSLPCMTQIYESKFPTIYNLWKIVSFGILAYLIAVDIFHLVKGFKDPESDKVEVLDL